MHACAWHVHGMCILQSTNVCEQQHKYLMFHTYKLSWRPNLIMYIWLSIKMYGDKLVSSVLLLESCGAVFKQKAVVNCVHLSLF